MNASSKHIRQGRPKDSAKREDIVLAATQLFLKKGYELTSMEAVAKKAGVSKLTIYSHFKDKKELFKAIIETRCDKVGMPVDLQEYIQLPVESALMSISRGALDKILRPESIRLIRIIHAEALHGPDIPNIFYEIGPGRVVLAFTELLQKYHQQGKLHVTDPAYASGQFFSLLKGEMLQQILFLHAPLPSDEKVDAHIKRTVSLFLSIYAPQNKTDHP